MRPDAPNYKPDRFAGKNRWGRAPRAARSTAMAAGTEVGDSKTEAAGTRAEAARSRTEAADSRTETNA